MYCRKKSDFNFIEWLIPLLDYRTKDDIKQLRKE